jgi:hypothetical protein
MDATMLPQDMEMLPSPPPSLGRARGPVVQPDAVMGVDAAIDEMARRAEEQWAPKYPAWLYKTNEKTGLKELAPPRKPEGTEFEDWMTSDMMLWGDFLRRVRYDLSIYRGMSNGRLPQLQPRHRRCLLVTRNRHPGEQDRVDDRGLAAPDSLQLPIPPGA